MLHVYARAGAGGGGADRGALFWEPPARLSATERDSAVPLQMAIYRVRTKLSSKHTAHARFRSFGPNDSSTLSA